MVSTVFEKKVNKALTTQWDDIGDVRVIKNNNRRKRAKLVPILQEVQAKFGYLPEEEIIKIAKFTGVSESNVFGVSSFYAQFRFTPMGKKRIEVCRGTACHVKGTPQILNALKRQLGIEEGETTPDMEYTLETVACIGCCAIAPCIRINKDVYGKLTPEKVRELFANGGKNEL